MGEKKNDQKEGKKQRARSKEREEKRDHRRLAGPLIEGKGRCGKRLPGLCPTKIGEGKKEPAVSPVAKEKKRGSPNERKKKAMPQPISSSKKGKGRKGNSFCILTDGEERKGEKPRRLRLARPKDSSQKGRLTNIFGHCRRGKKGGERGKKKKTRIILPLSRSDDSCNLRGKGKTNKKK